MGILEERRKASGLSRVELSRLSGVHINTLERYEKNGIETAQVGTVKKIADALEIWIDQLLTYEYDKDEEDGETTA